MAVDYFNQGAGRGDSNIGMSKQSFSAKGNLKDRPRTQLAAIRESTMPVSCGENYVTQQVSAGSNLFNVHFFSGKRESGWKDSPQQQRADGKLLDRYVYNKKTGNFDDIGAAAPAAPAAPSAPAPSAPAPAPLAGDSVPNPDFAGTLDGSTSGMPGMDGGDSFWFADNNDTQLTGPMSVGNLPGAIKADQDIFGQTSLQSGMLNGTVNGATEEELDIAGHDFNDAMGYLDEVGKDPFGVATASFDEDPFAGIGGSFDEGWTGGGI